MSGLVLSSSFTWLDWETIVIRTMSYLSQLFLMNKPQQCCVWERFCLCFVCYTWIRMKTKKRMKSSGNVFIESATWFKRFNFLNWILGFLLDIRYVESSDMFWRSYGCNWTTSQDIKKIYHRIKCPRKSSENRNPIKAEITFLKGVSTWKTKNEKPQPDVYICMTNREENHHYNVVSCHCTTYLMDWEMQ